MPCLHLSQPLTPPQTGQTTGAAAVRTECPARASTGAAGSQCRTSTCVSCAGPPSSSPASTRDKVTNAHVSLPRLVSMLCPIHIRFTPCSPFLPVFPLYPIPLVSLPSYFPFLTFTPISVTSLSSFPFFSIPFLLLPSPLSHFFIVPSLLLPFPLSPFFQSNLFFFLSSFPILSIPSPLLPIPLFLFFQSNLSYFPFHFPLSFRPISYFPFPFSLS